MEIIPAIDIKGGKAVRLRQGEFTQVETFSEDPVKYAQRWEQEGAKRLHVVDLDGARVGMPQNLAVIRQILRRVAIPVQVGGGIRSAEVVERVIQTGVQRVILGTSVVVVDTHAAGGILLPYGDKVIVGIDARDGFVAIRGWQQTTSESAVAFARRMVQAGARRIIFTDIARDGMMTGPNITALREILAAVAVPVIASGGVGTVAHVRELAAVGAPNLEGAILGKALYAGTVSLKDAISAAA